MTMPVFSRLHRGGVRIINLQIINLDVGGRSRSLVTDDTRAPAHRIEASSSRNAD